MRSSIPFGQTHEKQLRVKVSDGVVQTVVVGALDDDGFLHSGPDCADPYAFWTRFEDVNVLELET
jgi:hypothetical protein